MSFKIDALWAFLAVDDDGDEGIVAWNSRGTWFPAIGSDEARVRSMRPMVETVIGMTGKKVRLVKFRAREDLEVIE
jgi:hypothetical protein